MLHFVVYTHTDFLDILEIQNSYLKNKSKTLLINSNSILSDDIYGEFENVIFYDDVQSYSNRLLSLQSLSDKKYILLVHDIDIVLYFDEKIMNKIIEIMDSQNITRVDLQLDGNPTGTVNWYEHSINIETNEFISNRNLINNEDDIYLSYNRHGGFIYNVNPSIWNLKSFIEILINFPNLSYRQIESHHPLQTLMREKYKTYQLYSLSKRRRKCGYFVCLDFFEFLHITHGGRLIPKDQVGQHFSLSDFASNEYKKICEKFLKDTNRLFRKGMGEHEI